MERIIVHPELNKMVHNKTCSDGIHLQNETIFDDPIQLFALLLSLREVANK